MIWSTGFVSTSPQHCAMQSQAWCNKQCTVVQFWALQFLWGMAPRTDSKGWPLCTHFGGLNRHKHKRLIWLVDHLRRNSVREQNVRKGQATTVCLPHVLSFIAVSAQLKRQYHSRWVQCRLLCKKKKMAVSSQRACCCHSKYVQSWKNCWSMLM